jgi:N-acyl-D-aspartate/D-glutamate deacylase
VIEPFDLAIENGTFFDGRGSPARVAHVGIRGDRVVAISDAPFPRHAARRAIDARGKWVTPGFVDLHTHYDAEIELAPGLAESVKHGVTTVMLGSCSLSLALGTPEDLADQFCRVEAIPYEIVRPLLEEKKDWETLTEYFDHLGELNLGPNVTSFVGHSAVRAHVLGIARSLEKEVIPSEAELQRMEAILEEGLDQGYLGLSIQTLPWDKMGGDRPIRSRPLPSTFARWSEYRRLNKILRRRDRIFQGVPNVSTKWNVILFFLESVGLWRKTLKTTVISMMDTRANRGIAHLIGGLSRFFNGVLGADFRWQALPEVFDLWADGIDLVVFEEFGAGAAALHVDDPEERKRLLKEPKYRDWFSHQWKSLFLPKVFHRDFNQSEILRCPDRSLVGKSFAEVAKDREQDVAETFLDLCSEHGDALRWYTVMANDRREELEYIVAHPDVLIGFSDAGAHLRNMAHYNFPLRMLRLARDAELRGEPIMSKERAVERVTGEIASWLDIDAGVLAIGKRADLVILDPSKLGPELDVAIEAKMHEFGGFTRMINQNRAVETVLIAGRLAVDQGKCTPALGQSKMGQVLRAGKPTPTRVANANVIANANDPVSAH